MKRLVLTLLLALAAFAPRQAKAQTPIVSSYYCIVMDYVFGERLQCYTSMTGFLVYAMVETHGQCVPNNANIVAAENVFAACSINTYPTATATGWEITGSMAFNQVGLVGAYAELTNFPGNPEATKKVNCYGVPTVSVQPIEPC